MKALVTGGYFDEGGDGVVWWVDLATERAEVLVRWTPPEALRVPTKGFAGGCIGADGMLYVAAHAAVVRIDPARAEVTGVLHQPCMNDLHHVAAIGERLYVSNTGLGAVDVFDLRGQFLGSHAVLPAWANARRFGGEDFPRGAPPVEPGWGGEPPAPWEDAPRVDSYYSPDRRSVPFHRLKVPDHLHINHVSQLGDRLIATCFSDGTLRDLATFEVVARLPEHRLHDGVADGDAFWVTAIDGSVVELDAATLGERRRLEAFGTGHHGWCRGLAVTGDHLAVGMTEVRRGRLPRHRWADRCPEGSATCVLWIEGHSSRLVGHVDLTDPARHAKIYSILPLEVAA